MGSSPHYDETIRCAAVQLRALRPDLGDDRAQRAVQQALEAIAAALHHRSSTSGGSPR